MSNKSENPIGKYVLFLRAVFLQPALFLAGEPRKSSGIRLLIYSLRNLLVAAIFLIFFFLFVKLMQSWQIEIETVVGEIMGLAFGMPIMLAMTYFCLEAIRLFTLTVSGKTAADQIGSTARFFAVIGAVILIVAGMAGYMFLDYKAMIRRNVSNENENLRMEQLTYMQELKKGAASWNRYINSTPMHRISFIGENLDNLDLSGYDLHRVKFTNASLKNTKFDNCNLLLAEFDRAECVNTSFRQAYMLMSSFDRAKLVNSDFTKAFIQKSVIALAESQNIITDGISSNFDASEWRK
jgi:hypothetical protein